MSASLPQPATYFPFEKGSYDVLPGLRPFGDDFGNGAADNCVFQIDSQFHQFRAAKLHARSTSLSRHVLFQQFSEEAAAAVTRFVIHRFVIEHPEWFAVEQTESTQRLTCHLTGEVLCFDRNGKLVIHETRSDVEPAYFCSLDALACQVQEDLAVTCAEESANWVAALHVCLPSHWTPEDKLGKDFAEVHATVPGMEPFARNQQKFVAKMMGATNGLVRFVWGLQWDDTLNRHPACDSALKCFDPKQPGPFLRVERQTIWGLPESRASLFTIRPSLIDVRDIKTRKPLATALAQAIDSMSVDSLRYKGLSQSHQEFVRWLLTTTQEAKT
ncbi:MAG: DUF3445 domain-containing protein [Planctomycetaceae bacterium]